MSTIKIPVKSIQKIASFMERVPQMMEAIQAEAPAPVVNRKEAEARVADLVKYAGLDPARQGEFVNFVATQEGAFKTIASLTSKIASLQNELNQTRNLNVGGPSAISKTAGNSTNASSSAWCEALLG